MQGKFAASINKKLVNARNPNDFCFSDSFPSKSFVHPSQKNQFLLKQQEAISNNCKMYWISKKLMNKNVCEM